MDSALFDSIIEPRDVNAFNDAPAALQGNDQQFAFDGFHETNSTWCPQFLNCQTTPKANLEVLSQPEPDTSSGKLGNSDNCEDPSNNRHQVLKNASNSCKRYQIDSPLEPGESSSTDDIPNSKSKRKSCEKQELDATSTTKRRRVTHNAQVLKQWIVDHIDFPFPTADEKAVLCTITGLTMKQVRI
jgi:hypothetical protein